MDGEVQSLFTLVHTQVALTNCRLQYALTCVPEPLEDLLRAARASKAEICEDPLPGRSGSRNAKQSPSGTCPRKWQAAMMKGTSVLRGRYVRSFVPRDRARPHWNFAHCG